MIDAVNFLFVLCCLLMTWVKAVRLQIVMCANFSRKAKTFVYKIVHIWEYHLKASSPNLKLVWNKTKTIY